MPETKFLKCGCGNCGGRIEFPAEGIGSTIPCPHCGWQTELTLEVPTVQSTPSPRSLKWIIAGGVILLVGTAAVVAILITARRTMEKSQARNAPFGASRTTNIGKTTPAADNPRKLTNDFLVSVVIINRTTNSTLAYAAGALKNEADKQRFGVTVELELLDKSGVKIGTAKDYTPLIESRAEWKFRALLVQKNVAAARVANVQEQQ
jgi:hypothetical protein